VEAVRELYGSFMLDVAMLDWLTACTRPCLLYWERRVVIVTRWILDIGAVSLLDSIFHFRG
jgi:hypothetical protein